MKILLSLLLFIMTFNLFAHGENTYGPHIGYVRMPGKFHVEIVPNGNKTLDVYLMNVNNQNPKVIDSSVLINHYSKNGKKTVLVCTPKEDRFSCSSKKKLDFHSGKLEVEAIREKEVGSKVEFKLPLKLE